MTVESKKDITYNKWKDKVLELWEKGYSDTQIVRELGIHDTTLDYINGRLISEGYTRNYNDSILDTPKREKTLKESLNKELKRYADNKRKTRASGRRVFDDCRELYKIEKNEGKKGLIPDEAIETIEEFIIEQEGFFTLKNIKFYITLCCSYGKYEEALRMINDCIEAPEFREQIDKFVKLRNQIVRQKSIQTARRLLRTQPDIKPEQVAAICGLKVVDVYSIKNGKVPEITHIEEKDIDL